jgi:hypothetical protein
MKHLPSTFKVVFQRTALRGLLLSGSLLLIPIYAGCSQAQESPSLTVNTPSPSTGIARQSEPGAPYMNTWLLLGPFDSDAQNSGYDHAFIDEANIIPKESAKVDGKAWRYFDDRLFSRNYDDYNDLYSYYAVKQNGSAAAKVAYVHTYVHSQKEQNLHLRVGADTGFKAWVNGTLVAASTQAGPTALIQDANLRGLNGGRDFVVVPATLNPGWNRLLLKITNTEEGRFGFFARFTTTGGNAPKGLDYSIGDGTGPITITTRAMPEAKTGVLPTAFREWPYVEASPDIKKLLELGQSATGPEGQRPPQIPSHVPFEYVPGLGMQASPFKLAARGGQLPYSWTMTGGGLPAGMKLETDGTLRGTPTAASMQGDYKFSVELRDGANKVARRDFVLNLKERPNRWIESARMIALMHGPERVNPADVPKLAQLMKRQGYTMGMPISYNNGEHMFRYPSAFGKKQTDHDYVATFKAALEEAGLQFGMYMGNLNVPGATEFPVNKQHLMVREAIERYHPKALWFDWLGMDGTSLDSLFSTIKSIDPEIVIILNGATRPFNGDWDIISFEGWGAWNDHAWKTWPVNFPWPKKTTPETWRLPVEAGWSESEGETSQWSDVLRVQLSVIGEGFIGDIDHSASIASSQTETFENWPLVKIHEEMADWANPVGKPPLYEAYTHVDRGPLPSGEYGYNTINLKRDTMYVMALKNPRGKTGLPKNGSLIIGAVPGRVKSVTLMNSNTPLQFTQHPTTTIVTINTKNIKADPVATIIKVQLSAALSREKAAAPPLPSMPYGTPFNGAIPPGNLATGRPAWLMSADDSHELVASAGALAIYGVDADPNSEAVGGGEWAWSYKIDLQHVATIRRIVAVFGRKHWATEYKFLVSVDGKEWKTVAEVAGNTDGGPKEHTFAPTQARFVRIQSLKPDGPDQPGVQMGIADLQVFEN